MNRLFPVVAVAALASGCAAEDPEQVLVPEDVDVRWDRAFNGVDDDRAVLIPVDVMIYQGESGLPVSEVEVTATAPLGEMALVDPAAITPAEGDPDAFWDAWSDRYFTLDDSVPTGRIGAPLRLVTDNAGIVRFYVWVDSFPPATPELQQADPGAEWSALPIVVDIGEIDDTFLIVPR
jgi:hypothetical protein